MNNKLDERSTITLHTGAVMPVIGLGTWRLTRDTTAMVRYALELGYRMVDTSSDYGSQPGIGEALDSTDVARDDIFLVTKIEEDDDPYGAVERDLTELQQEYSDLVLIHRPPAGEAGIELWHGLMRVRDAGLARNIGVSNYTADQIQELIDETGEVPAVNQIEWSPFGHSEDMLAYCRGYRIVIQAYSPLTRGSRLADSELQEIAAHYGKTPAQVLLRWNIQMGVVPLPKAGQRSHLGENFDIFDFEISDDDMATLNGLNEGYSSLGSLPYV